MSDDRDRYRYLLPAPKCMGRGVEVVAMTVDERELCHEKAARIMSGDMGAGGYDAKDPVQQRKYYTLATREMMKTMLRAVTVQSGLKMPASGDPREVLSDAKVEWRQLDVAVLETDAVFGFGPMFLRSVRDYEVLNGIFQDLHGFSDGELANITGKALPVAGG